MDDEEEDTSRPRGAPLADLKYGERAARIPSPALALVPRVRDDDGGGICALACDLQMQPGVPFHDNATWRWHFPARFEPLEDRGARRVAAAEEERRRRREGDDRTAERPGRRQRAAPSAEAQIGQKLREIGDKFQRDHLDAFLRQQRQNLPAWMRLTMALFGFLFPRPFAVPPPRAEQR
ncbi:BCL2 modifying factor 2 [Hippocampus zosterae]|uniref:BCL2 modifying factor 2 n=1 Tax=Hippocampus zosterae TaxID=109293 RepID=UPI00223DED0A|nr:BCL2 modifying factor 2 [Hippocampus zosterae]XP_051909014.1 BCL2 modifying factor 2 [Hippocampus zosterae]